MPWAKSSDTAAHHPVVLAPAAFDGWAPPRWTQTDLINLLAGIFHRAATESAGYTTDYVVRRGVLYGIAGDNWLHWAQLMERAGYLTPTELPDGEHAWKLIDDPEHLVHIRLKDELDWERQRRADNGNPALVIPVRLRDGDGCRYCGVIVVWGAQKGGRGGTYDHRTPGKQATGPDDLRVSCRACNSRRKDHPDADEWCPPLPAPVTPHYGPKTVALLAEHGHHVRRTTAQRPGRQPDPAPRAPRPPAATPRDQHKQQDQKPLANPSNRLAAGFGSPGREGNGTGAQLSTPTTPPPRRSRRGRRGGRRPSPGETHEP